MVLSAADRFGDAEAVVDGPLRRIFTELVGRIRCAAGAFAELGVGKAFVVAKDAVGAEELIAWCRERMAGFKVPRSVKFLEALPLNATGKVVKDRLR
ncbi:AMP-binding enzyme [Mycobacterium sp. 050134]|uniref:AMP-binding enzyme n=1 Tax=Mycobacterium sp. 050134 TaxID=3096111 RepID=UPI002EDA2956